MLKSCQLFENGGNYDGAEIQWYQTQMDEINEMITTCKTKRRETLMLPKYIRRQSISTCGRKNGRHSDPASSAWHTIIQLCDE